MSLLSTEEQRKKQTKKGFLLFEKREKETLELSLVIVDEKGLEGKEVRARGGGLYTGVVSDYVRSVFRWKSSLETESPS